MVFAFPLRNAILSLKRDSIAGTIAEMGRRTPPGKGQLVFIENHDMNRFASEVGGDARKERIGAALNILLDGTPLIYYGQEIGMKGRQNKTWGTDANDIPVREAFEWARRSRRRRLCRLGTGAPAPGGPIATPRMPTDYRSRRRRAIQPRSSRSTGDCWRSGGRVRSSCRAIRRSSRPIDRMSSPWCARRRSRAASCS